MTRSALPPRGFLERAAAMGAALSIALGVVPVHARPGPDAPTGFANISVGQVLVDDSTGNGNGLIEPNECVGLAIQLYNGDPVTATGLSARIESFTPGVSVVTGVAAYPDIPGTSVAYNVTSFRISTSPSFTDTSIELAVHITVDQGNPPPRSALVPAGRLFQSSGTAAIPDNDPAGAFLPVNVSGLAGALTEVVVTVYVVHPVGHQLDLSLESPGGTTIDLSSDNGLGANFGNDCLNVMTFDDAALTPVTLGMSPFPGPGYRPEQPLSTLEGVAAAGLNGQWRLRAVDDTAGLTGTIQCVTLRIQTDSGGAATCRTIAVGDKTVVEGHAGTTTAIFPVTMDAPSAGPVSFGYLTGDLTATAPDDYTATSGILTFQPGETSKVVAVSVAGDLEDELDEQLRVVLTEGQGGYVVDNQALGTIYDDDGAGSSDRVPGLSHGFEIYTHLVSPNPTVPDVDVYLMRREAYSSYEIVVDAASGDVSPVSLQRFGTSGTSAIESVPIGVGPARSLRWAHDSSTTDDKPIAITVRSGGCTTDCGADDTYRLRAYDTTRSITRFNNANSQVSVLILQSSGEYPTQATILFWSPTGTLLHRETQGLAPRGSLALSTHTIPALQGASGSLTVIHDARYGDLTGKVVTIEPATGFSFDSPMNHRAF
jgi:subtilisin-like proprotein convertase family protein